ncbi:MAG: c-type cytochrome [Phycisphaerae bacterium]
MSLRSALRRGVRLFGAAGISATALGGLACSGPIPLSVAIHSADEDAYLTYIHNRAQSPREAFYAWKAEMNGRSVAEVRVADNALSTGHNPFSARKDNRAVSQGAVIYKYNCRSCHGERADGRGRDVTYPQPTMDAHRFAKRFAATIHGGAPRKWFRRISEGRTSEIVNPDGTRNTMPPFANTLAREQIWLVITYLQSLDVYAEPEAKDR